MVPSQALQVLTSFLGAVEPFRQEACRLHYLPRTASTTPTVYHSQGMGNVSSWDKLWGCLGQERRSWCVHMGSTDWVSFKELYQCVEPHLLSWEQRRVEPHLLSWERRSL